MYLQLRIFNPEYSTELICAAVGDMPISACVLYCKFCAKYRAQPPVYAMWTVVPDIYNVFTAPYIQTSIFIWTYLLCYCTYHDNRMRVMLQTCYQIQRTSSSLCYVNCGPGYIQSIFSSACLDFNIQLWPSALLLYISRQFNSRYTANLVPNTAHILQFMLCELWSRPYTMYLQLRILSPEYSTERICAAVWDIPIFACALDCKFGAIYRAHPPVYDMRPVVPTIYKVFSAPHI
jgi:hypothetical protein